MAEVATTSSSASPPANPMLYPHTTFDAVKGLMMDGVSLAQIAEEHSTPTYVYSIPRVMLKFRAIRDAFAAQLPDSEVTIHFSMKSNPSSAIIRALVAEGAGIDCVSAGEVHKALAFGCPPSHIVFAGVGKSAAEIEFAVQRHVGWFNVENEEELAHIQRACEKFDVAATNVALRVNPNVAANTHPSIATGHGGAKFGLPMDVCARVLDGRAAWPRLRFAGLHVHIGSQLGDVTSTLEAVSRVVEMAKKCPDVTALNIGGGFPVQYVPDPIGAAVAPSSLLPTPADFAAAVAPIVKGFHVMLEPGRSIAADAGVLLTRSLYRKDQAEMTMLIVDASMVEVMRPALYSAYHDIVPVEALAAADEPTVMTTVVGPVCESTDVLNKGLRLQESVVRPGALFAIMTCGAYCSAMAGNYNARPLCAEVAVTAPGEHRLCRKRQTFDDLLVGEIY